MFHLLILQPLIFKVLILLLLLLLVLVLVLVLVLHLDELCWMGSLMILHLVPAQPS